MNKVTDILNFSDAPTDIIPIAEPVTINTTSGQILAANSRRKHVVLQNNGTEPCIVRLGTSAASTTAYNFVLGQSTGARDGLGGTITINNFQGAIQGKTEANSTVISVMELLRP